MVDESVQGQRRPRAEIHHRQGLRRHPDGAGIGQGERGQDEDGTGETDQVDEIHGSIVPARASREK